MKLNRLFPIILASSLCISFVGCDDNDSNDDKNACDCATGANCSDDEKAACKSSGGDQSAADAEKESHNEKKCDCATGANCSDDEKAACKSSSDDEKKCDCTTGTNCSDDEKAACAKSLEDALKDLNNNLIACNFSKASQSLDAAWKLNKSDVNVSFQRSVLGLMNLLHHEKIQALMLDLGFNSASVNFDNVLWSSNGLFAQMVNDDKDFGSVFEKLPHKVNTEDMLFEDSIKKTLKLSDIASAVLDMKDTFLSLAESFEATAKAMDNTKVLKIEKAGCSLNEIGFSAADLYAAAALMNLIVSASQLASAYALDITLYDLVHSPDMDMDCYYWGEKEELANETVNSCKTMCSEYINQKNALNSILKLSDASKSKDGRESFVEFARLIKEVTSVSVISPQDSFLGWSFLTSGVISDVMKIALNIANSDGGSKSFTIDQITPAISVDLTKIFDTPISTQFEPSAYCTIITNHEDSDINWWIYPDYGWDDDAISNFLAKTALKTIVGRDIFIDYSDPDTPEYCDSFCHEWNPSDLNNCVADCIENNTDHFVTSNDLSSNFSSAWGNVDIDDFINPNEYFYSKDDEQVNY